MRIVDAHSALPELLANPAQLRSVAPDIHSILPDNPGLAMYNGRSAALYDRVVGTQIYNRLVWGTSPEDYAQFANTALRESHQGWLLDAGGGSLLFTAEVYSRTVERPILVLDQSRSMLELARRRLVKRFGRMPPHIVLLQGDLLDLGAFVAGSIRTVLSLGVLHHIEPAAELIANLGRLLGGAGRMHLTSLITSGRWADVYLKSLYRSGGFAPPRSAADVQALFEASASQVTTRVRGSMLYAVAAPR